MDKQFVITALVCFILIVAASALVVYSIGAIIGERDRVRGESGMYNCCDHCGLNFPEVGQSYCEREPNSHTVPCDESGCVKGTTHAYR